MKRTFSMLFRSLYFHVMMLISSTFRKAEQDLVEIGIEIHNLGLARKSVMHDIDVLHKLKSEKSFANESTIRFNKLNQHLTELNIIDKQLNALFDRRREIYDQSRGHQYLMADVQIYFPELRFEGAKLAKV